MPDPRRPFRSIYSHGFARVAVGLPKVKVADPRFNADRTLALIHKAAGSERGADSFPELGISAYSNEDLFHQDALLEAVTEELARVIRESADFPGVILLGAPLRFGGRLFNCAVVASRGEVLGIVPKTYLPNYREFYEKRQFAAARDATWDEVEFLGYPVPFGNDLIFAASNYPHFCIHAEICEDLWTPVPPSTYAALTGATVLCNLSASNITIGKSEYRRNLCATHSGKCIAAYLYSAAGPGESTTDVAWDGEALIYENNDLVAAAERFPKDDQLLVSDIDLERLIQDRMRQSSFSDTANDLHEAVAACRHIPFELQIPDGEVPLQRHIERFPYVPSDARVRNERCFEAYSIQVQGLTKRMEHTKVEHLVIGVSGGLDSTHALIVAAKSVDRLGLPRERILAYTMPGFATSDQTLRNAHALMKALGVTAREIDIRPSCLQMFRDLNHPYASGQPVYDVTFENVQAGERTSHLFRLANMHNGMVVGTGDLSELALGWCTYGVGDHMSHYNVNASIPKTLIQHLIRWIIATEQFDAETSTVLQSILDTEISPELIPATPDDEKGAGLQSTESKVGPYDLQDFNLYYTTRYGFRPSKTAFLAEHAWADATRGSWPADLPDARRRAFDLPTIKQWLEVFLYRFFQISQFKRSCIPNGPKVGSGGSLSPRGDWRAPSDSEATVWLEELRRRVP